MQTKRKRGKGQFKQVEAAEYIRKDPFTVMLSIKFVLRSYVVTLAACIRMNIRPRLTAMKLISGIVAYLG